VSAAVGVGVVLLLAPLAVPAVPAAPPEYRVARTQASRAALLAGTEDAWSPAARISWGRSPYETAFRALWDQEGLRLRFFAQEGFRSFLFEASSSGRGALGPASSSEAASSGPVATRGTR
jgi:hypothetical protein